jgi:hypothetical protein
MPAPATNIEGDPELMGLLMLSDVAVQQGKSHAMSCLKAANQAVQANDMKQALKLYTEGLEGADFSYDDPANSMSLSEHEEDAPSIDTAASHAYEVSCHMSYAAALLAGRAHVHVKLEHFKEALADANMAIVSCPSSTSGYMQRGYAMVGLLQSWWAAEGTCARTHYTVY